MVSKRIIAVFIGAVCLASAYYVWFVKKSNQQSLIQHQESTNQLLAQSESNTISACAGFSTQSAECDSVQLKIQGSLPTWLRGTIIRTGPGMFDLHNETFKYWFDGFALLHNISFNADGALFSSRLLKSDYYQRAQKNGKLPMLEQKKSSIFSKLGAMLSTRPAYDNGNINISKCGDSFVALTATPLALAFNPVSLETYDIIEFDDKLEGHVTTPHPCIDPITGEHFNLLIEYGTTTHYHLYSMAPNSTQRTLICSIPTKQPSYMHSLALSKQYIILTAQPFVVNPSDMLFNIKPYFDYFSWKPELNTEIIVVNRHTGKIVNRVCTEPFFTFNHLNAFEENGTLHIDLVTYPDATIIKNTALEHLRKHPESFGAGSQLKRISIDLDKNTVKNTIICTEALELPRMNNEYKMKNYQFAYGVGAGFDRIIKIDLYTKKTMSWNCNNCYPGEPIFVANNKGSAEDDGVLISTVLDACANKSFVVVLNAQTMKEVARMQLPVALPFSLHGQFFNT
ncbi:MAG: Apocarotenoid-15,15'-oxygenase [Candidatus Dependentiae bacterium ADurb.Bin331]|nr:MAG: Apocarotenoid-15,15'-oxygenase [Candidatus Dependentiae bacterium ADurb.Bin331]